MRAPSADAPDLVGYDDVLASVEVVVEMLSRGPKSAERWQRRAGQVRWTCRKTLAHVVDCLNWYAVNLARQSTADVESPDIVPTLRPARLVDGLRSAGAVLSAAVSAAQPDDRGWHPYGRADRSGFAAMGCDEVLVHGFDLAAGLGETGKPIPYEPLGELAERVARRLFPWSPDDEDPWTTLLWAMHRCVRARGRIWQQGDRSNREAGQ